MKLITNYNSFEPYTGNLVYHCVWFGTHLDHHILSISSLLCTQKNPSVILWTDNSSFKSLKKLIKIFSNYDFTIKIGEYDECSHYDSIILRADFWRLQILKKWGGIYFDLDIVFLKDISWFVNYGPIVNEGYSSHKIFNNSIMYFPKNHFGLNYWLEQIGKDSLGWKKTFEIQKISNKFGADMIPNSITDRGWTQLGPSCDDFFDKIGLSPDTLGNSLLYHWHNRWNKSLHKKETLVNFFWKKFVENNFLIDMT